MLNSLLNLSNFKLIVPLEAANNFVMAIKLELFITSTMVRFASGVEVLSELLFAKDDEKELEVEVDDDDDDAEEEEEEDDEEDADSLEAGDAIVSSKELNFVKFIIQPSSFLSSFSSVTFCQDTFKVVDDTASTITSSGWPGNVLIPSATP